MSPAIIGIGEPLAEFNQLHADGPFAMGFGGDTSNCIIAAARAGASTGYITRVGDDLFGDGLLDLWAKEGVDASQVKRDAHANGIYFITHGADGHRFTYVRQGSAACHMQPGDIDEACIRGARVLHFSAISQAISLSARSTVAHALAVAEAAGVAICYDTNLRLKLWTLAEARGVILDTVPHATFLRPSIDDAKLLLGEADPDRVVDIFLGMGAKTVLLTLGEAGAIAATTGERHHIMPRAVKAVDASGAGDAFSGAFLAAYVAGQSLRQATEFANAAAALSVTRMGTIASYVGRAEIETELSSSQAR